MLVINGGGIGRGLYRGTAVTLFREAQAYGVWFLAFEYLMARTTRRTPREQIPAWKIALYGGLAGEALWLSSYPFDIVKSKLQTDSLRLEDRRYVGMVDCAQKIWAAEGMLGFWRGITPTLLRAMPVSAGTFFVYVAPIQNGNNAEIAMERGNNNAATQQMIEEFKNVITVGRFRIIAIRYLIVTNVMVHFWPSLKSSFPSRFYYYHNKLRVSIYARMPHLQFLGL
jgi:hypothetical protein